MLVDRWRVAYFPIKEMLVADLLSRVFMVSDGRKSVRFCQDILNYITSNCCGSWYTWYRKDVTGKIGRSRDRTVSVQDRLFSIIETSILCRPEVSSIALPQICSALSETKWSWKVLVSQISEPISIVETGLVLKWQRKLNFKIWIYFAQFPSRSW